MFQALAENPAEFQRIMRIPHNSPTQSANYANSTHFALKFTHISLTFRSLAIDREPGKIGANRPDFAQFAHNSRESRKIHTMTSRLGVNPENSRDVQRITQILHLSHSAGANNAKFATFAMNTR